MTEANDPATLPVERDPGSGLLGRARMRPVLYPVGILAAFVLMSLVRTGVTPDAAGRPLLIAVAVGLLVPWVLGLVVGDRDRAGVLAIAVVMLLLAGQAPVVVVLPIAVFALVLLEDRMNRGRPRRIRWAVVTRVMSAVTAILLVAIGFAAVQEGRMVQIAHDLVAEAPLGHGTPSAIAGTGELPSVYLVLLDGYPRADKLMTEFGINIEPFTRALRDRAFAVADHSRSNHAATRETLASMFSGRVPDNPAATDADFRPLINEGTILREYRDRGYEVIAFATGFGGVDLRQADRFVDAGQLNEFERHLLGITGLMLVLDRATPALLADQFRARILTTLDGARSLAGEPHDRPRMVLAHVMGPHSPLILGPTGERVGAEGMWMSIFDRLEYEGLGLDEYSRRLAGEIAYLNARVLELVDSVVEADPDAVVVVFSDHGSGIREQMDDLSASARDGSMSDVDLRTANLLAVRSPGLPSIIDDRSTLVNLLPRILRAYTGSGPADVPETIYGQRSDGSRFVFDRPD